MVISIVVSFLGRNALEWFVELTTFGAIVGFGYTSASAWRIAGKEKNRRVLITGVVGTAITACFAVVQLIPKLTMLETMGAASFLMLALWCLLGFVFYWRTMRQSRMSEYRGSTTSSTVLFSLLLYCVMMWFVLRLLNVTENRALIMRNGAVAMLIIFVGLVVMLYIQNLLRQRHELLQREIIRAEEGSRAKTQFLFNMSHDIRTPMNAIIGFADLARRSDDPELVRQYLDKIAASGDHLLALINDVLEMSRIESGKMQLEPTATDLVSAMEQVHDLFVGQMSAKGIGFTVETSVTDRWVLCDKTRLDRVLLNLISNAGKFTPEGGSVAVTLDQTGASGADRSYRIRVCDTGVGMSEEFAQKVFNAFERASTADSSGVQGTGLGMAITKSIIEMMHGTISVDTAPGKGTTFTVDLTLTVAQEPVVRGVSAGLCGSMDCSKLRLLLVEDNEINREIATFLLREQGFRLDTAVNGREAVDMVAAAPGAYDAVLMDVQMPVMNGYDATHAIRALDDPAAAGVPIIAMTANAFQEDVRDALEAGMDAHIAKPFDFERIMETLSGVLSKKRS